MMPRRLTTDNTYRCCSRCGKELTDPASRECGVGPVCRGKDNHLYAKLIPANIPMAGALVLGIQGDQMPSACEFRWLGVRESFVEKMAKVQSANEDMTQMKLTGADFREEVRNIDWLLSYRQGISVRTNLISIVRHLGYPGLAAVLSGEASKSKAKVWFEAGRIHLQGTGCTPGFRKMKQIRGISTPKFRGSKDPYSAPASQSEAFMKVVIEHWPLYEGSLDDIRSEIVYWAEKNKDAIEIGNASLAQEDLLALNTTASLTIRSNDFVLSFKWLNGADVKGMINELKKIPSKERAYNPTTKNWLFRKQHLSTVKGIVSNVYDAVVILNTNEETPNHEWKKTNPYRKNRGYRTGYWSV